MLKTTRNVLSVIVLMLAGYSLISGNHQLIPLMMLSLGTQQLVIGRIEFEKGNKRYWYMAIVVSVFIFYVSIQGFWLK